MHKLAMLPLMMVALLCLPGIGHVASLGAQGEYPELDASRNGTSESEIEPRASLETSSATVVFSCSSPVSENDGLTWDGSYLWIADLETRKAYQVDPTACTVLSSFSSPGGFPTGLAWDGSNLWNSDTNCDVASCVPDQIDKLSASGSVLATFPAIGSFPTGLAYDGMSLWHSDNFTGTIYRLRLADLSIGESFASPGPYPNDLAWDGRYLWVIDNGTDMLYKVDVGQPLKLYLPLLTK